LQTAQPHVEPTAPGTSGTGTDCWTFVSILIVSTCDEGIAYAPKNEASHVEENPPYTGELIISQYRDNSPTRE
jgi:hypothetical protein